MAEEFAAYLWAACGPLVRDALGWRSADAVLQKVQMPRVKHFAELFCGTGGLVAEVDRRGLRCSWFDFIVDDRHNLLTPTGFAIAIDMAMAIVPKRYGMVWRAMQHLCLDKPGAYEEKPGDPAGRRVALRCAQ